MDTNVKTTPKPLIDRLAWDANGEDVVARRKTVRKELDREKKGRAA